MQQLRHLLITFIFGSILSIATLPVIASQISVESPQNAQDAASSTEVRRFTAAIGHIKNFYVEDVSDKKLFEDAIHGMIAGLDPHSAYLNEQENEEMRTTTMGEFGGLGLEIGNEKDGAINIISPIEDSPAAKAGIKAGDLIIRIDNAPVQGMTVSDAVKKMRGAKGTKVKLTILRDKNKQPMVFDLKRDLIHTQSVKSKLLDKGLGYIRITMFQAPTAQNMLSAEKDLIKKNGGPLNGMILDLRNNPGGLLDSAIDIADAFIDTDPKDPKNKLLVFTKGRLQNSRMRANATPGDILQGAPLIVLINEGSASASEIVAGALQDQKRAIIVGKRSFGKGSVQTILPLDDKTAIKITTARYYTPSGRSIQAKGIEPDVIIDEVIIPQTKTDEKTLIDALKESDLQGHLINNEKASSTNSANNNNVAAEDLLHTDYQLYQALSMLKGLVVMHATEQPAKVISDKKTETVKKK